MINVLFKPPLISFLSLESGKWIIINKFGSPIKAMLYDAKRAKSIILEAKGGTYVRSEIDGIISLEAFTWPYSQHFFDLSWTELVTNKKRAEEAEYESGPLKGKKKYTTYDDWKLSDIVIGTRKESTVPYLREDEIHPASIEFTCKDGGNYVVVVQITTRILNPIMAIQLENFLLTVNGRVTEAIGNWGRSKTFAEARKMNADDVDDIHQIQIGGRYFLEVINESLEGAYGIIIPDVSTLRHFAADNSADLIESEEKIIKADNEAKAAVHEAKRRETLNTIQDTENQTELKYQSGVIGAVKDAMVSLQQEKTKTAEAYAGKNGSLQYLNIGNDGNQLDMGQLLATLNITGKKGGTNAT